MASTDHSEAFLRAYGSCVRMAGGGMGSATPPFAIGGSQACSPAAAATDTAEVFQHQEGGPALRRPDI